MLEQAIKHLKKAIKKDYIRFATRNGKEQLSGYMLDQVNNFDEQTTVTEGSKYIKIIRDNTVWGFVVKADFKHFKKGDILKAAGWNAPALNKARGNILDGGYTVRWTGPLYLK
jgi:hypothetical protein